MDAKEKLFLELVEGFTWKYDDKTYPFYVFMFKDNVCLFEICSNLFFDKKKFVFNHRLGLKQKIQNVVVFTNEEKIISIFQSRFKMSYDEVNIFLTRMLEKHINLKLHSLSFRNLSWANIMENHFNGK